MRRLMLYVGAAVVGGLFGWLTCPQGSRVEASSIAAQRDAMRTRYPALAVALTKNELLHAQLAFRRGADCARCSREELCSLEWFLVPELQAVRHQLCGSKLCLEPSFDVDDCFTRCLRSSPDNPFSCERACLESFSDSLGACEQ